MSANLFETLLQSVDLNTQLWPYLALSGWRRVDEGNRNWLVWQTSAPDDDDYELVFPRQAKGGERREYARKAVEFLAALIDESEERTIQRIINYDRDVLFLRNTATNASQTLPLPLAADHVRGLERIILYAASAEYDPKPYYERASRAAQNSAREFSFGHTLPGSFIFTVTAPRLPAPSLVQLTLKNAGEDNEDQLVQLVDRPLSRRIGERLARGLVSIRESQRVQDYRVLLEDYHSAFNANMCQALIEVVAQGKARVEFAIAWSPKLAPAHDVEQFLPVEIDRDEIPTLKHAAKELRNATPEPVTIQGNVRGLTTNDNPRLESARRAVILHGNNPKTERAANFVVELSRDDYRRAVNAHTEWAFVQVTGTPVRSGDGWRLLEPRDFKVFSA